MQYSETIAFFLFGVASLGRGFGLTAKCIHRRKRRQPYFRMARPQIAFILTNMSSSLLPCFIPITVERVTVVAMHRVSLGFDFVKNIRKVCKREYCVWFLAAYQGHKK